MSVAHLNRSQRRAAEKAAKAAKKPSRIARRFSSALDAVDHLFKPIALLHDCRPIEEREVVDDFLRIRAAVDRLKDGSANDHDFECLVLALMIAGIRAVDIDDAIVEPIEAAMSAMTRCKQRRKTHGSYGFDGPGLQDVMYAIEINEEIVRNSTRKQLMNASDKALEALKKGSKKAAGLLQ